MQPLGLESSLDLGHLVDDDGVLRVIGFGVIVGKDGCEKGWTVSRVAEGGKVDEGETRQLGERRLGLTSSLFGLAFGDEPSGGLGNHPDEQDLSDRGESLEDGGDSGRTKRKDEGSQRRLQERDWRAF